MISDSLISIIIFSILFLLMFIISVALIHKHKKSIKYVSLFIFLLTLLFIGLLISIMFELNFIAQPQYFQSYNVNYDGSTESNTSKDFGAITKQNSQLNRVQCLDNYQIYYSFKDKIQQFIDSNNNYAIFFTNDAKTIYTYAECVNNINNLIRQKINFAFLNGTNCPNRQCKTNIAFLMSKDFALNFMEFYSDDSCLRNSFINIFDSSLEQSNANKLDNKFYFSIPIFNF